MRGHERIQLLRGLIVPEPVNTGLKPYMPPQTILTMSVYPDGVFGLPGEPIGLVWDESLDSMMLAFVRPNTNYSLNVWEASVLRMGSTVYQGWERIGCALARPKYGVPQPLYLFGKKIEGLNNG